MPYPKTYTVDRVTKTVTEWAAHTGLSKGVIWKRLQAGWPVKRAITAPLDNRGRNKKAQVTAPFPPFVQFKQQQLSMERQLKRSLRLFIRESERQAAMIGRDFARRMAAQIDIDAAVNFANHQHAPGVGQNFSNTRSDRHLPVPEDRG